MDGQKLEQLSISSGIPLDLLSRSIQARAEATGVSSDDILNNWSGGDSMPTPISEVTTVETEEVMVTRRWIEFAAYHPTRDHVHDLQVEFDDVIGPLPAALQRNAVQHSLLATEVIPSFTDVSPVPVNPLPGSLREVILEEHLTLGDICMGGKPEGGCEQGARARAETVVCGRMAGPF